VLTVSQLPAEVLVPSAKSEGDEMDGMMVVTDRTLKDLEREYILKVLTDTGWHKGRTCEILGISRPRLERRIDEFGFARNGGQRL
jgi:DNA-binding NtrC family response regulator